MNLPIGIFKIQCIFSSMVVKKKSKQEIPFWHRKGQKSYRINRIVILFQMVAAVILSLVIWFGIDKVIQ